MEPDRENLLGLVVNHVTDYRKFAKDNFYAVTWITTREKIGYIVTYAHPASVISAILQYSIQYMYQTISISINY